MTGDLLMDPVWEAISRLERQGIRVLALTCDGASVNRRLWKLLGNSGENIHKVDNIFAPEAERPIFFISDPPHLLKTLRNCLSSKTRKLWVRICVYVVYEVMQVNTLLPHFSFVIQCNGQSLEWSHIEDLYKRDTKAGHEATGLRLVPKLKFEHIYLSSFSKMRVDLAAQVSRGTY